MAEVDENIPELYNNLKTIKEISCVELDSRPENMELSLGEKKIWCIQRADCAMKFKMPPIPKLIIKIKTGVSIQYYPNAAEATEYINPSVADYFFRPDKYFMNQRGPSGIIFLHMVATDECRVPLFGGKHKCYGISVVDRVVTHQPLMPYIPSQPRD